MIGAGVAGLSAAHELAERGFEVTVYERRRALGGKARSIPVPYADNAHGVHDNLVHASTYLSSRAGGRPDVVLPFTRTARFTPQTLVATRAGAIESGLRVPPDQAMYFARKLGVYVTSCDERRLGQWEHVSWAD